MCFVTALPDSYFQNLNQADFVNYFVNSGKSFQPNSNQLTNSFSMISLASTNQSSQENFVFSTLNNLALYYSSFSSLNAVNFIFYPNE